MWEHKYVCSTLPDPEKYGPEVDRDWATDWLRFWPGKVILHLFIFTLIKYNHDDNIRKSEVKSEGK